MKRVQIVAKNLNKKKKKETERKSGVSLVTAE